MQDDAALQDKIERHCASAESALAELQSVMIG